MFCVRPASRGRGCAALWGMCDTVVILLDYHSSKCVVLFLYPLSPGSNLTDTQILSTQINLNPNVLCPYRQVFFFNLFLFNIPFFSLFFFFILALNFSNHTVSQSSSILILLPLVLVPLSSRANSSKSSVEQGIGKKKIPFVLWIMFACHQDKIDEMLCLASDLRTGLRDACWEKPLSKLRIVSPTHFIFSPHSHFHFSSGETKHVVAIRRYPANAHKFKVAPGFLNYHLDLYVFGVYEYGTWHVDKTVESCGFRDRHQGFSHLAAVSTHKKSPWWKWD